MATVIYTCFGCDHFWSETLKRCPKCGCSRFSYDWDEENYGGNDESSQEAESDAFIDDDE